MLTVGTRLSVSSSIRADAWAYKQLGKFGGGKLIMHAWLSRGMVTREDMAQWRFDGSMDALTECMKFVRGSMRHLYRLEGIGDEDYSEEAKKITKAENGALVGETAAYWAIIDEDVDGNQHVLLPTWWSVPITRSISIWQKESDDWQQKLTKRRNDGKHDFAPKAKEAYEKWKECHTRRIVLNKKRQSQVMNLAVKNLQEVKSSCLLLEISMSDDPNELRIRSGGGKYFKLVLLEGVQQLATSEIPEQLDLHPGAWLLFVLSFFANI